MLVQNLAGQQGQPKYGFGWPDDRLGGLGPAGSTTPAIYRFIVCVELISTMLSSNIIVYHY